MLYGLVKLIKNLITEGKRRKFLDSFFFKTWPKALKENCT